MSLGSARNFSFTLPPTILCYSFYLFINNESYQQSNNNSTSNNYNIYSIIIQIV